jgi:ribonucleoside-diphosphate reductase alpha chain
VFERTVYPLPAQQAEAYAKRRMGIGVTGMANALEVCGHRYGSSEYITAQSKILEVVRDQAYRTSIDMARVKGPFPLFDADKWLASGFAQTLPDEIRHGIKKHGLRNGVLLSIAPTGTISMAADNVSGGIEPPPAIESERIVLMPGGPVTVALNDWAFEEHGIRCKTAHECSPEDHVRVLCEAQRFVDSSISKTINVRGAKTTLPEEGEMSFKDFKEVYMMAYNGGAKGCATFNVNGKRKGIIAERVEGEACSVDPMTGAKTCG